jgi:hypothetical protein
MVMLAIHELLSEELLSIYPEGGHKDLTACFRARGPSERMARMSTMTPSGRRHDCDRHLAIQGPGTTNGKRQNGDKERYLERDRKTGE